MILSFEKLLLGSATSTVGVINLPAGTTSADGINFGDVSIYRSASGVISVSGAATFAANIVAVTSASLRQSNDNAAGWTQTADTSGNLAFTRISGATALTFDLSGNAAFLTTGTQTFGAAVVSATTASTSTTTGSLINAGGFGNAGAAYIGGRTTTRNLTVATDGGEVPLGGGDVELQVGYANSALTSVVDAYVLWAGSSQPLNVAGVNGSLVLASRNVSNSEVVLATQNTVRGRFGPSGLTLGSASSITAASGTDLTLAAGSSGASLVLGQGASGKAVLRGSGLSGSATEALTILSSDTYKLSLKNTGTGYFAIGVDSSDNVLFFNTAAEKFRLSAGGNLLIGGTTDIGAKLTVYGNSVRQVGSSDVDYLFNQLTTSGSTGGGLIGVEGSGSGNLLVGTVPYSTVVASTSASTHLQFGSAGVVRATLTYGGNLLVGGTTDNGSRLQIYHDSSVTDGIRLINTRSGGKSWVLGDGAGVTQGTFGFYGASDAVLSLTLSNSAVAIPLTTASTSTTTGALVVSGGVGVAGSIRAGGLIRSDLGTSGNSLIVTGDGSNFQVIHNTAGVVGLFNSGGGVAIRNTDGTTNIAVFDTSNNMTLTNGLYIGGAIYALGNSLKIQSGNQLNISDDGDEIFVTAIRATASYDPRLDIYKAGNSTVGISLNPATASNSYFSSGLSVQGSGNPASGSSVEILYGAVAGTGSVLAYDRTGGAYRPLQIDGLTTGINLGSGGLTTIGSNLTVNGNTFNFGGSDSSPVLNFKAADTGSVTLNFGGTTNPDKGRIVYSDNSDLFDFYTADTARMRLDTSGNLTVSGKIETPSDLRLTSIGGAHYILIGNQDSAGTDAPTVLAAANTSFEIGKGNSWSANGGGTFTRYAAFTSALITMDVNVLASLGITAKYNTNNAYAVNIQNAAGSNIGGLFVDSAGANSLYLKDASNNSPIVLEATSCALYMSEVGNRAWRIFPSGGDFNIRDDTAGANYFSIDGGTGTTTLGGRLISALSVANSTFELSNTHASGYGGVITGGNASNYAFYVRSYDLADIIIAYKGTTHFLGSTASTSTTTGTVVISGGMGMTGDFHVGGFVYTPLIRTEGQQQFASFIPGADGTYGAANYMRWYRADGSTQRAYFGYASSNDQSFHISTQESGGEVQIRAGASVRAAVFTATSTTLDGDLTVSGGNVGVGGAVNVAYALNVTTSTLTGDSQYGLVMNAVYSTAATTTGTALYGRVRTAAGAFTMTNGRSLDIDVPEVGAGATIATQTGIRVANQGASGITNAYGIYISAQSGASSINVGLHNLGSTILEGAQSWGVSVITGATTVSTHNVIVGNSASGFTVTLVAASSNSGRVLTFKNKNTGLMTLDATSLGQIDGGNTVSLAQYDSVIIQSDGSTWNIIG